MHMHADSNVHFLPRRTIPEDLYSIARTANGLHYTSRAAMYEELW